jgi:hypothetical protein
MGVFSRSWNLFSSAWQVLKAEKSFVAYPILAVLVVVVLSALILGGGMVFLAAHPEVEQALNAAEQQGEYPPWAVALSLLLLFLYFLAVHFVINFFLTALVGAALQRLEGRDPSFADGIGIARNRTGVILGYAAIAATVGVVLSLLRSRQGQGGAGAVGAVFAGMGGLAWGVATFLVVPVLAAKGLGPIAAIKESADLLRKTWGEQLTGAMGMGAVFGIAMFSVFLAGFGLAALAVDAGQQSLVVPIGIVAVTLFALIAVINSTLMGIYRGAVYLYADTGEVAPQFERSMITRAFGPKR